MPEPLPRAVAELVDLLAAMPGVCAVALGGSRAEGAADAHSDWDLGVYYRGAIDTSPLSALGTVHPPGAWGRVMNGGAWLEIDCSGPALAPSAGEARLLREVAKVDVLLRDLDAAERWTEAASRGHYEVDGLLGYLAGIPTYSLSAELATGRVLRGALPAVARYPPALAEVGARDWRFRAEFSLSHARMRAERGDLAGALGQAARAAMEAAHAVQCRRGAWVLNEKRLLERAGVAAALQPLFGPEAPPAPAAAPAWVARVRSALGIGAG
jgi:hypothetical protein